MIKIYLTRVRILCARQASPGHDKSYLSGQEASSGYDKSYLPR